MHEQYFRFRCNCLLAARILPKGMNYMNDVKSESQSQNKTYAELVQSLCYKIIERGFEVLKLNFY